MHAAAPVSQEGAAACGMHRAISGNGWVQGKRVAGQAWGVQDEKAVVNLTGDTSVNGWVCQTIPSSYSRQVGFLLAFEPFFNHGKNFSPRTSIR